MPNAIEPTAKNDVMTDKRKVLGRGLETLLPSRAAVQPLPVAIAAAPAHSAGEAVRDIPLSLIDRNPYQTRSSMDGHALEELAASIKQCGVLQPITVRAADDGRFKIIAGERRWLASQLAGKETVPAIVRHVSNQQALEITIIENLQREDLNPIEQARGFERLARQFELTQEQIAIRTGKERSTVGNYMRLLKLPLQIQALIEQGELSVGHVKVLMPLGSPVMMADFARRALKHSLSVRQLEKEISAFMSPPVHDEEKPQPPVVDPNVREAERQIKAALGMAVTIKDSNGKGRLIIQYANLEEFDRLLEALVKG
jgi:ParB family chromosome partitioning protein